MLVVAGIAEVDAAALESVCAAVEGSLVESLPYWRYVPVLESVEVVALSIAD